VIRKRSHPVEHGMGLGYHVHAVNHDRLILFGSQCDMQNCAFFGGIDLLAAKHRVDVLPQAGLRRKIEKQAHCFGGDAVLRIIKVETCGIESEALPPLRIFCKELPKVHILYLSVMLLEGFPGWLLKEGRN
jgi:hypothetical protein